MQGAETTVYALLFEMGQSSNACNSATHAISLFTSF